MPFRARYRCPYTGSKNEWRERALAGMDAALKERENDPLEAKLGEATRRIGELVMEVEILRKERQARHPLGNRTSWK